MMKKSVVVLLLVSIALLAQAQVKFGVKGGINITNMSLDKDVFLTSNRTGFYIGPTVKLTLPVVGFGVDGSVLYDQRESMVNYGMNRRALTQKQVAVPLNVNYQLGFGDMCSVMVYAGPQFGFNIAADDTKVIMQDACEWHWKESNLSLNLGGGLMLLNHFFFSVNYNVASDAAGEFNFPQLHDTMLSIREENKLHSWQIGLTYYF